MKLPNGLKAYWSDGERHIIHGDCREVLPMLGTFDLLLTDPPYGIGRDGKPPSTSSHGGHKGYRFAGWDSQPPSAENFLLMLNAAKDWVIWGANYFTPHVPPGPGWLMWDKGQRIDQADGELAATSRRAPLRIFTLNRVAIAQDGAFHPTQKPLRLMTWCLSMFPDANTILDPYMGSGTTLRAAKDASLKCVGIEQHERYCAIAARRLEQNVLEFTE